MPTTARRYTVDEVLAFPDDGNRYEVIHGELFVTPAPRLHHQAVLRELHWHLMRYLDGLGLRHTVFWAPADIMWGEDTLVQPDLFVVPPHEVSAEWKTIKTLLLAVEALSPSSRRADRITKRRLYQEQKVGTYWIVDPEAGVIEVWHPGDEAPELVTGVLRWQVSAEAPVLEIPLQDLFSGLPPG
jgi:Uma2 family endonuclease